jgi:hypothetical protein
VSVRARLLGVAVALSLAGCGGSRDGRFQDPEAEAAAAVLRAQAAAVAAGDGDEACSFFSPRGRAELEATASRRPELQATGCAAVVEEIAGQLPAVAIDALTAPVISSVRVRGRRADATVEPPADLKELALAAGFTDVVADVRLVKLGGDWKVDAIPLAKS